MGYSINLINGKNFVIRKENFEKALESLKSVFVPEKCLSMENVFHGYGHQVCLKVKH